jgi:autophagy-related protein 101
MSNCEVFQLPQLELLPHQAREALRCLLHTVLFNRALGQIRPRDVESELFDGITYVR